MSLFAPIQKKDFPEHPFYMTIIGPRGSGKTSLVHHIIEQHPKFNSTNTQIFEDPNHKNINPHNAEFPGFGKSRAFKELAKAISARYNEKVWVLPPKLFVLDDVAIISKEELDMVMWLIKNRVWFNVSIIFVTHEPYLIRHYYIEIRKLETCIILFGFPRTNETLNKFTRRIVEMYSPKIVEQRLESIMNVLVDAEVGTFVVLHSKGWRLGFADPLLTKPKQAEVGKIEQVGEVVKRKRFIFF